jgi:hypothetical protein
MRLLGAALLGFVIGLMACGDSLIDHRNTKIRDQQQQPTTCNPGTATCIVNDVRTCLADSVTQCGATCADCTATVTPPAGAHAACIPPADNLSQSTCGWQCTDGFLKCPSGCCTATALAAGAGHTCAITSDQSLVCWGRNDEGQVTGTPSAAPVLTPHQVFASGVTAISAGTAHTCATVSGQVQCIGRNADGEAPATHAVNAVALAAGDRHTCALGTSGGVTCWGASNVGQTGNGGAPISSGAFLLAAGADHTCALLTTGEVRCWGTNASGELGTGLPGGFSAAPQTPQGLGSAIAAIGVGAHHACASTGTKATPVRCWGANPAGPDASVLPGLPDPEPTPAEPQKPSGGGGPLVNFEVAVLAGGRAHTCIQRTGETVKCFGADDSSGQLGVGLAGELADPGTPLPGITSTSVFAVGGDHACVVAPAGTVSCWGSNASGQLGDGTITSPPVGTQVPVSGR